MTKHKRRHSANKNTTKLVKELVGLVIILISTTIIIFNNIGQSITLFQLTLSRTSLYWIAGIAFALGVIWTFYLNKIIRLD